MREDKAPDPCGDAGKAREAPIANVFATQFNFLPQDVGLIRNLIQNGFLLSCFQSPGLRFAVIVAT
jgi:hypothetical protein